VNQPTKEDPDTKGTNIAASFPLVLSDPRASPLRPRGPKAILRFPPSVRDPAAINDFYIEISGSHEAANVGVRTIACK